MESIVSATSLFTMSKSLNSNFNPLVCRLHRHLSTPRRNQILRAQLVSRQLMQIFNGRLCGSNPFGFIPHSSNSIRSLCAVEVPAGPFRLGCVASSAASFASDSGGGDGGLGGSGSGGGGGGGASENGEAKSNAVAAGAEEASTMSPDVIILDVGGMVCGGCAASVKRILESQPQVSSASVNLTTETAIIWPLSEAKVTPDWKKHLGETLAKHLTSCGFKSNPRVAGQGAIGGDIQS